MDRLKVGISSYSLVNYLEDKRMTILDAIDYISEVGGESIELVPFGFELLGDDNLIEQVKARAKEKGIYISNYAILADLLMEDEASRRAEIERVKSHVEVAYKLGLDKMRHDVSSFRRPMSSNTAKNFEREFSLMVEGCIEIADYAKERGITTLVENHGFFVNGSDRVIRLVENVNRDNFGICLDIGNFLCVDEFPETAILKCLPYTKMIHLKDFYIRKASRLPNIGGHFRCDSGSWFATIGGNMLRGAIFGQGDIDMFDVMKKIKHSGYSGDLSLEFEGMEDGKIGCQVGFNTVMDILSLV